MKVTTLEDVRAEVLAPNRLNTLVFGGLRMIRTTSRESKLPGLGDIPLLGNLFKNHRSQKQQTDLYFFVTPQLL